MDAIQYDTLVCCVCVLLSIFNVVISRIDAVCNKWWRSSVVCLVRFIRLGTRPTFAPSSLFSLFRAKVEADEKVKCETQIKAHRTLCANMHVDTRDRRKAAQTIPQIKYSRYNESGWKMCGLYRAPHKIKESIANHHIRQFVLGTLQCLPSIPLCSIKKT